MKKVSIFVKTIFITMFSMLLLNCVGVKLEGVTKTKNIPGLPNIAPHFNYAVTINSKADFEIQRIELQSSTISDEIKQYSLTHKETGYGSVISKPNHKVKGGSYLLSFDKGQEWESISNEKILVTISCKGKLKQIKSSEITVTKVLVRR